MLYFQIFFVNYWAWYCDRSTRAVFSFLFYLGRSLNCPLIKIKIFNKTKRNKNIKILRGSFEFWRGINPAIFPIYPCILCWYNSMFKDEWCSITLRCIQLICIFIMLVYNITNRKIKKDKTNLLILNCLHIILNFKLILMCVVCPSNLNIDLDVLVNYIFIIIHILLSTMLFN